MISVRPLLLALITTLLVVEHSHAALFWVDEFSYPDGQLTDSEAGAGDNVSGGLWTGHSGTAFDDNVAVISGKARIRNSGSEDVNRATPATMGSGETWYYAISFTVNFTGTVGDPINNDYFAHFKGGPFGFRARTYLDDPNIGSNDYTLGLSATSGGQVAKWATDLQFGAPQILVVSYSFDTGESRLWINPMNEADLSLVDTGGDGEAIDAMAFRQDFVSPGIPNNEILIDAVAVGDDFASVLAAVPEPSVAGFLTVAGILVTCRRRRTTTHGG